MDEVERAAVGVIWTIADAWVAYNAYRIVNNIQSVKEEHDQFAEEILEDHSNQYWTNTIPRTVAQINKMMSEKNQSDLDKRVKTLTSDDLPQYISEVRQEVTQLCDLHNSYATKAQYLFGVSSGLLFTLFACFAIKNFNKFFRLYDQGKAETSN